MCLFTPLLSAITGYSSPSIPLLTSTQPSSPITTLPFQKLLLELSSPSCPGWLFCKWVQQLSAIHLLSARQLTPQVEPSKADLAEPDMKFSVLILAPPKQILR